MLSEKTDFPAKKLKKKREEEEEEREREREKERAVAMALDRSRRNAGTSYMHSDAFVEFIDRLRTSDKTLGDCGGRILRLKRYLPSDVGPKIVDLVIEALSLNTNVEALYIQNFEKGMHDEQLALLTHQVLKKKKIWALNIGENFRITHHAWGKFLDQLPETSVSFLYVSEHHLKGTKLKDLMRDAIRENRSKLGQRDVDVIKQITNMWYNPKTPEQLLVSRKRRQEQERLRELEREREKERVKKMKGKLKLKKIKGKKKKKKKMSLNRRYICTLADLVQKNYLDEEAVLEMKYKEVSFFPSLFLFSCFFFLLTTLFVSDHIQSEDEFKPNHRRGEEFRVALGMGRQLHPANFP